MASGEGVLCLDPRSTTVSQACAGQPLTSPISPRLHPILKGWVSAGKTLTAQPWGVTCSRGRPGDPQRPPEPGASYSHSADKATEAQRG